MKKIILVLLSVVVLVSGNACAFVSDELLGYVPQPRLQEPRGEHVDLTDKNELTFSWGKHVATGGLGKYYDFRLYKGTEMVVSKLIFKKRVPGNRYELSVPSTLFDDNGVYTLSLKLCYRTRGKSCRSLKTFQVVVK